MVQIMMHHVVRRLFSVFNCIGHDAFVRDLYIHSYNVCDDVRLSFYNFFIQLKSEGFLLQVTLYRYESIIIGTYMFYFVQIHSRTAVQQL